MKVSKKALALSLLMEPVRNTNESYGCYGYICINGREGCIETGYGANALRVADDAIKTNFNLVLDYGTAAELVANCQGEEIVFKHQNGHEWQAEGITFCEVGPGMEPQFEMRFLEREGKINDSMIPAGSMNLWRKLQTAYGLDPVEEAFKPKFVYCTESTLMFIHRDGSLKGKLKKVVNMIFKHGDLSLSVELSPAEK